MTAINATPPRSPMIGALAIALAVGFNVPFAALASLYNYPAVLRSGAGDALSLFAAGGANLIWAWQAFLLSAIALTALAPALSITPQRLVSRPALAVGAAISGALAGLAQAIGLSRWVFAVPGLARLHGDGGAGKLPAEQAFDVLNAWGGVAIGEHIGQLLTALFVLQVARLQKGEGAWFSALLGFVSAGLLVLGTGEGLAIAQGRHGDTFSLAAIAGFTGLTAWLIATGTGLIRARRA